jgi:hypothetical protein
MNKAIEKVLRQHTEILTPPDNPAWCVAHSKAHLALEELRELARHEEWQTRKAINCCAAYLKRSDRLFTKRSQG